MGTAKGQSEVVQRAQGAYRAAFGGKPAWGAAAPGRVNLIGDHTDYTGGLALPMAVDLWCAAVAGPAAEPGRTRIVSADRDGVAVLDVSGGLAAAAEGLPAEHWARYAAGVMAELEAQGQRLPALDVAVAGSVPVGSGLSSSAALEVAVAALLERVTGAALGAMEKARLCQRAEHRWAGVACGVMDQLCAVMGREGHALLMDFAGPSVEAVAMPRELAILVADSGVERRLAAGTYSRIVQECEEARRAIGVRSLREVTTAMAAELEGRLEAGLLRRVRHVASENARVRRAVEALRAGDLGLFGGLMIESHGSLADQYGVSCAELDSMVEILTGMGLAHLPGVYGARMTGAGFGGCIVAAVAPWAVRDVSKRLKEDYRRRHGRECRVMAVKPSDGATLVDLADKSGARR